MIECEPKYVKRFREIIQKVRKKMIQDDRILQAFELVTNLMSKCDPEYEKLLCEVLEKVREKITRDGGNDNICKIEKLDMKVWDKYKFEEELDKFVTGKFLKKLRDVEETKHTSWHMKSLRKWLRRWGMRIFASAVLILLSETVVKRQW